MHQNVLSAKHHFIGSPAYLQDVCSNLNVKLFTKDDDCLCTVSEFQSSNLKDFLFFYARRSTLTEEFVLQILFEIFLTITEVEREAEGMWNCSLDDIYLDSFLRVKLAGTYIPKTSPKTFQVTNLAAWYLTWVLVIKAFTHITTNW